MFREMQFCLQSGNIGVVWAREQPDRSVRELYDNVSNLLNHSRDFSCGAVDHAELRLFDFPRFRVKATWFLDRFY